MHLFRSTTTTPIATHSINCWPLSRALLLFPLVLACFALSPGTANAQVKKTPIPDCPSKDCQKVVTIYNNTKGPIWAVIQAGFQDPDPWLQAYFNNNPNKRYQPCGRCTENHYSRFYVNPDKGIPGEGGHVSVTVPWWSELKDDPDKNKYVDWYNGGRVIIFDNKKALDAAREGTKENPGDKKFPLSYAPDSPRVSCADCEKPLTIYSHKQAYDDNKVSFQLVEYTFVRVEGVPPNTYIKDLNVGYNISYLDQIYLPIALAPCGQEPCDPDKTDRFAVGYLGTTADMKDFRTALTKFANEKQWPQYKGEQDPENHPHLPGTYNVLVDRVDVAGGRRLTSRFTNPDSVTIKNMIDQWNTCTTTKDIDNCPQFEKYQELDRYFRQNWENYINKGKNSDECPQRNDPKYYPVPARGKLTSLDVMKYAYGWAAFNSGCNGSFNQLVDSPGPEATFKTRAFDYIHRLQYNYERKDLQEKQWFNPFTELVHRELNASSYAFSIDDAVAFQSHPGEGLIVTIGGAKGLPNPQPVPREENFLSDFVVTLGDSLALKRPRWKSLGVCKDVADTDFPPLAKNAETDTPKFIVDTVKYNISRDNPCTVTITDAADRKYQFTVSQPVPWPTPPTPRWKKNGERFDPNVVTSVKVPNNRFWNINEIANEKPPQFSLLTDPPLETSKQLLALENEINSEIHEDKKDLKELPDEPGVQRLLDMRLAIDEARKLYPTDEELKKLDQKVEARKSLGPEQFESFRTELNTRLAQLYYGH
jgi:hypothetical protein